MSHRCSRNFWDRREFLFRSGGGISGLALAYLLDSHGLLSGEATAAPDGDACTAAAVGVNPYAPKPPHFKPRATAVISLFMGGGWSQVDTFDPKPALAKYAGGGPLGGPNDWSAGFIPAAYQGTLFRSTGDPIVDLKPPAGLTPEDQRARLDTLAKLNELDMQKFPGNSELAARISSYELAYRMQGWSPGAVDIASESVATRTRYGLDEKVSEPFGRKCRMARRLGGGAARCVQIFAA